MGQALYLSLGCPNFTQLNLLLDGMEVGSGLGPRPLAATLRREGGVMLLLRLLSVLLMLLGHMNLIEATRRVAVHRVNSRYWSVVAVICEISFF